MQLYPHNQKALEALEVSLAAGNKRAAIVHPTGTGKSYIISAFINARPELRGVVITPSVFIAGSLKRLLDPAAEKNVIFWQYQGAALMPTEELEQLRFDYIILDELHRAGAPIWQAQVEVLLAANPNAIVVGTSATPIRFLDDQRNMAVELLGGNVVSELTLVECFAKGILPAPKFVSALYSVDEMYREYCGRIMDADPEDGKLLVEELKRRMIDWEASNGLEQVIARHLTKDYKKIIVFSGTKAALESTRRTLLPILQRQFDGIKDFVVHSEMGAKENDEAFRNFSATDVAPHVLFCIDMLNEGIHVKDVNAVIMLRETTSPTIFYQQIGRCLSADNDAVQPLVLDLVNNFKRIRVDDFKREYDLEVEKPGKTDGSGRGYRKEQKFQITFLDETQDVFVLFEEFAERAGYVPRGGRWVEQYEDAKRCFEVRGTIMNISSSDPDFPGVNEFVKQMRARYRGRRLPEEKIQLLEAIGIDWEPINDYFTFAEYVGRIHAFVMQERRAPQVSREAGREEKKLKRWLNAARRGEKSGRLTPDNANLLKALEQEILQVSQKGIDMFEAFVKEEGHADVPAQGHPISKWAREIRLSKKKGKLSGEMEERLRALGFDFDINSQSAYKKWIATFQRQRGALHIPEETRTWLRVQTGRWEKQELKDWQIQLLTEAGIKKTTFQTLKEDIERDKFSRDLAAYKAFVDSKGRLPSQRSGDKEERRLYVWFRSAAKRGQDLGELTALTKR